MFGPLAFGAVEPWSIAVLQTGSVILFLLWTLRQYLAREISAYGSPLFAPAALFGGVLATQIVFQTSAYTYASVSHALDYVIFALLMFLAAQAIRSEQHQKAFVTVLAVFGFALAWFAIIQSLTSNGMIYWIRQPQFASPIYGPYVNRNHYAGLMEMLAPLALVLCSLPKFSAGKRMLFGFAALVMSATIILSGSRGGLCAFVAELAFLLLISAYMKKRKAFQWGLGIFFLLLLAFLFWADAAKTLERWSFLQDELKRGRSDIARDSLHMFSRRPFLGWGLGSFRYVYPQFRNFYTDYLVNEAHNDFLQVVVETGLAGAAAMVWFIIALYRNSFRRLRDSRFDSRSAVRLAAITGCTGLLVHSLLDFNLHIPANAALFYVLCVIAAAPQSRR
jgi:O-antigen ligase